MKSGGGFYDWEGAKKGAPWSELPALAAPRGSRVAEPDEIVDRCVRAMWLKARDLLGLGNTVVQGDTQSPTSGFA